MQTAFLFAFNSSMTSSVVSEAECPAQTCHPPAEFHRSFVLLFVSLVPGGIASESLTFTPLEDMIFLKWEEPLEANGLITQYEVGSTALFRITGEAPGAGVMEPQIRFKRIHLNVCNPVTTNL